jgi:23S rRNA (uracil1939-C5)-methyltransferase
MSSGAAERAADNLPKTVHVDDLLANGQGVGRDRGLVVFVSGALPGEEARISVDAVKRSYLSAHATEILTPSPDRMPSHCPVFPRCGGCQTLHYRYAAQLLWKQRMVKNALERLAGLQGVAVAETVPSVLIEQTRYRNKASLVCEFSQTSGRIGFYAARSHRIVPIERCPVLLPWLDDAVHALAGLVESPPVLLRGVRHVVLRTGLARESLVMALCSPRERPELTACLPQLRKAIPGLSGIVASWDPPSENAIFGRRFATLWGSQDTVERISGLTFRFGTASFFQINSSMLERIAADMLAELRGAKRIVDLYCGVGTFAVLAGKRGTTATGVESSPAAVDEAAENAARNGVANAAFECATAAEAVAGSRGRSLLEGADAVILDPPRRGCEPEVLHALARHGVPRVLYLSCNPATLARDARTLADSGYRLRRATPFDMFAFTGHVEILSDFILP